MGKSSIEAVEEKLPPGFRFYPRDEELICDYLMNRVVVLMACDSTCTPHTNSSLPLLIEVDLNKTEPWQIPETACVGGKQWYFYSRRDKRYATGLRTNRATGTGYWKATGKDRTVSRGSPASVVGMRKTLVFYRGRAPKGRKSDWVMHEFRLEGSSLQPLMFSSFTKEDLVLCRVFHKDKEDTSSDKYVSGSHGDHRRITPASLSSLPPLMDDPYISFTQTQSNSNFMMNHPSNLQVPCFSIFSQNQTMSYCYPSVVAANVPELQSNNAPSPRFKSCSSNSGAYDVVEADSDQRNRPNLKVVTSNDPASNKLKSKISSSDDDFGDGNRDSYLSMSMWRRHHQY